MNRFAPSALSYLREHYLAELQGLEVGRIDRRGCEGTCPSNAGMVPSVSAPVNLGQRGPILRGCARVCEGVEKAPSQSQNQALSSQMAQNRARVREGRSESARVREGAAFLTIANSALSGGYETSHPRNAPPPPFIVWQEVLAIICMCLATLSTALLLVGMEP